MGREVILVMMDSQGLLYVEELLYNAKLSDWSIRLPLVCRVHLEPLESLEVKVLKVQRSGKSCHD